MVPDKLPSDIAYYLENPSFLKWVVYNDEAEGKVWKEWLVNNPDYLCVMEEAKEFLTFFFQMDRELRAHIVDDQPQIWEKIQTTIQYLHNNNVESPSPKKRHWSYAVFASVLSAILLLAFGFGIYYQITPDKLPQKESTKIRPGEKNALLQLANGKGIWLDSIPDGVLPLQHLGIKKFNNTLDYRNLGNPDDNKAACHTISTPMGSRYKIILPDGTAVWLNSNSVIKFQVPFAANKREVEMFGECFFDVTHNPKQPFLVKSKDAIVKVFGTQFNIKAYKGEPLKVSLVKGKVNVADSRSEKTLQPGEEAVIVANQPIALLHENNIDPSIAWKDEYFSFKNSGMDEVMRQLSKWYKFDVIYQGNISEKFNGRIPMNTEIDKVFKILELTGSVKFEIQGRKVFVSKK